MGPKEFVCSPSGWRKIEPCRKLAPGLLEGRKRERESWEAWGFLPPNLSSPPHIPSQGEPLLVRGSNHNHEPHQL